MDSYKDHKVGTLPDIWTIYTKSDKQFRKDTQGVYHYKDHNFHIEDGRFIFNGLNLTLPQRTEISTMQRVILSLGIAIEAEDRKIEIDVEKNSFKEIMHILTTLALKDLSIISNAFTSHKQLKYGEVIFDTYLAVVRSSGNLSAKTPSIRWLNEQDTLKLKSKLFDNSNSKYRVGGYSMKYLSTPFAEKILATVFQLLKAIDFKQLDIELEFLDFTVTLELLEQIRLRDVMLLLNCCIGYNNGFIIRSIIIDSQYSRVYSIFTSISSDTRTKLGFYNYDVSSALQTICMHLVQDPSLYPLHQKLVDDKIKFRTNVMHEMGKDIVWVKTELNKIDNLDIIPKRYKNYPTLQTYFHEAQKLRKEIVESAEPLVHARALEFAKTKWKKGKYLKEKKEYEWIEDGKKESSIFFFIWTQWERQIRQTMMGCFDTPKACHEVHDAVYSREQVDCRVIEARVFEETGFRVKVSVG